MGTTGLPRRRALAMLPAALTAAACATSAGPRDSGPPLVLLGGTVIDGRGSPLLRRSAVVIRGRRIAAVAPANAIAIPVDAQTLDVSGCFLIPGFVDANVHLSLFSCLDEASAWPLRENWAIEQAQIFLRHGVTSLRDSYSYLQPVRAARDGINSGRVLGPRIHLAGNIVGWGGPFSNGFYAEWVRWASPLDRFQLKANAAMAQGVGEDLQAMTPREIRRALRRYIEKGVDFIKYGATPHTQADLLLFDADQQRALIDEAHNSGLPVDVHADGAGPKRLAAECGVDLIQHLISEASGGDRTPFSESFLRVLQSNSTMGSVNSGEFSRQRLNETRDEMLAEPPVGISIAQWEDARGRRFEEERARFRQLIDAGVRLVPASDSGQAPWRTAQVRDIGRGTLHAVIGLVELGMTPTQALMAATWRGAQACRADHEFGTLEPGKLADIVVLEQNPLEDIANIFTQRAVLKDGLLAPLDSLPEIRAPAAWRPPTPRHCPALPPELR